MFKNEFPILETYSVRLFYLSECRSFMHLSKKVLSNRMCPDMIFIFFIYVVFFIFWLTCWLTSLQERLVMLKLSKISPPISFSKGVFDRLENSRIFHLELCQVEGDGKGMQLLHVIRWYLYWLYPTYLRGCILGILAHLELCMWSIFELFLEQAINCWQGWIKKHSFEQKIHL